MLGIAIEDQQKLLDSVFASDNCPDMTTLSLFGLADLNLPHGSQTPEIYKAAQKYGAKKPTAGAALRVLAQHPNIFRSTNIEGKQITTCLIGIEPIVAANGKKYVIVLAEIEGQLSLRFRRADEYIRWSNIEWWVFAT